MLVKTTKKTIRKWFVKIVFSSFFANIFFVSYVKYNVSVSFVVAFLFYTLADKGLWGKSQVICYSLQDGYLFCQVHFEDLLCTKAKKIQLKTRK